MSIENTESDKSEMNIKELFIRKTDIQIMNIIGEGIPNYWSHHVIMCNILVNGCRRV